MFPYIKICCIKNETEAKMAISNGAASIGLVGKMPGGPGVISDDTIRCIAKKVPPPIATFLLTSETDPRKIIQHHQRTHTSVIQMVDSLEPTHYDVLKKNLPGIKLVQVVHVLNEKSVEYAIDIAKYADALLLDSGNPEAKIKELGGTGRTHDWRLSAKIRKNIDKPLFLAGGLNSDNVAEAIRVVNPFGIDVCSGVRTNDTLDEQKLRKFMQVVRKQQVL